MKVKVKQTNIKVQSSIVSIIMLSLEDISL